MPEHSFIDEIEKTTGVAASECYQCFRCTNGCPAVHDMDITPHRIIGYIISGERDRVLSSGSPWACLQCAVCSIRCPNGIDVARVFAELRRMSVESGLAPERNIHDFDVLMIESISRHGRLHELGVVIRYRLARGGLLRDAGMGIDMIRKKRIGIFPHKIADRKGVRSIIRRAGKGAR